MTTMSSTLPPRRKTRPVNTQALIGHTGFVGQTLRRQHGFAAGFNSANIAQAAGQVFDLAVCAAAPGSMFEANRFPEKDAQGIDRLCASLAKITAKRFVLISTIAVLARFDGGADETTHAFQTDLAYGRNRRRLESFCAEHFPNCLILRLPALFGAGLKKNFLFDLRNPVPSMLPQARFDDFARALGDGVAGFYHQDEALGMMVLDREGLQASPRREAIAAAVTEAGFSALGFTNPDSRFQFYDMSRLWDDLQRGLRAGVPVLHLAPEALRAGDVHFQVTGRAMPPTAARLHVEDMQTGHAELWGRQGRYICDAAQVMAAVQEFAAG